MAIIFTNLDRRVIPNWKSFAKTSFSKELCSNVNLDESKFQIDDYIFDWESNKQISFAGDLLSAAIANNQTDRIEVKEAANQILKEKGNVTESQIQLAKIILTGDNCPTEESDLVTKKRDVIFDCIITPEHISKKIAILKKKIQECNYNPILYVELSRYYICLGQVEQSIKAMRIALFLDPSNRFIVRSAARLFLHLRDKEQAHYILRKSSSLMKDPWLLASEISIALLQNKSSRHIKKGLEFINSKNFHSASISELASSIATLEFINGSNKKSKKLFQTSLIDPNDNSLAQAEWAMSNSLNIDADINDLRGRFDNNFYESRALACFIEKDFNNSIIYASEWIEEMQFAKRPILFASTISTTFLKDYTLSQKILKIGLQANPSDSQLINNIAYNFALGNDVINADKYLSQIKSSMSIDPVTEMCLLATKGLVLFRKGQPKEGRELYINAIEKSSKFKESPWLNWIAVLNYAREELLINSEYCDDVINSISKIKESDNDFNVKELKKDVYELIEKRKENTL